MDNQLAERIRQFNAGREKRALRIKYDLMGENAFRFFRGTCHLFYEDLLRNYPFPGSPSNWISGDLHIENFGSYKGIDRSVYFDINDFDEAVLAPVLLEMARLAVSVELATEVIKFSPIERAALNHHLLHHFRHAIINDEPVNIGTSSAGSLISSLVDKVSLSKESDIIHERTTGESGNRELKFGKKLLVIEEVKEKQALAAYFANWFNRQYEKKYKVIDLGFRIAGTGSIGVQRYCLLLENEVHPEQKKLIDIKQSLVPCALLFQNDNKFIPAQPAWTNDAERIVAIQQLMQKEPPAYLDRFSYKDQWFVIKELQPTDDKICIEDAVNEPGELKLYLEDLGRLTAAAQLRSCGKYGSSTTAELKEFANDHTWVSLLIDWSAQYAEQVKKDFASYKEAMATGFF